MTQIKLTKRSILKHDGTMTVDVNVVQGEESFTKSFKFPICHSEDEVKMEIKEWLEEKEECDSRPFDPDKSIDISKIKTDRLERREYQQLKKELIELNELKELGVIDDSDSDLIKVKVDIKAKYKKMR